MEKVNNTYIFRGFGNNPTVVSLGPINRNKDFGVIAVRCSLYNAGSSFDEADVWYQLIIHPYTHTILEFNAIQHNTSTVASLLHLNKTIHRELTLLSNEGLLTHKELKVIVKKYLAAREILNEVHGEIDSRLINYFGPDRYVHNPHLNFPIG